MSLNQNKLFFNQLLLNFSFVIRDNTVHTRIIEARDFPPKLVVLARAVLRDTLIEQACGKSIYPIVRKVITWHYNKDGDLGEISLCYIIDGNKIL